MIENIPEQNILTHTEIKKTMTIDFLNDIINIQ